MKIIGIIPARYASTRFPGKPLVEINGISMIQRVYQQVEAADSITKTIVATDDERIYNHVKDFGGNVMMTLETHKSGTERIAEVIKKSSEQFDGAINIQGDEPFIQPRLIDDLANFLVQNPEFNIATAAKKITDTETLFNPNAVKVVFSQSGKALYFSRQTIPYIRGVEKENWLNQQGFFKHIGIYAFRTPTLLEIIEKPISNFEKSESLEQLRWLENNYIIGVLQTKFESIGIDTPEDLLKV